MCTQHICVCGYTFFKFENKKEKKTEFSTRLVQFLKINNKQKTQFSTTPEKYLKIFFRSNVFGVFLTFYFYLEKFLKCFYLLIGTN